MNRKQSFTAILLALSLAVAACNLPARSQTQVTPVPPPVVEGGPLPPAETENCPSPVAPGIWTGSVQLASSASRMGITVLQQQAALPLNLRIECDGTISGSASRTGQATLNVPLAVDGLCTDSVQYDVRGDAAGSAQNPVLNLYFTAREGALNCDVNSRIGAVPTGEQHVNVAGQEEQVQVTADAVGANFLQGQSWPDHFYREQLPDMDRIINEYELEVESSAGWSLTWQTAP
jgi:hypothetical protein